MKKWIALGVLLSVSIIVMLNLMMREGSEQVAAKNMPRPLLTNPINNSDSNDTLPKQSEADVEDSARIPTGIDNAVEIDQRPRNLESLNTERELEGNVSQLDEQELRKEFNSRFNNYSEKEFLRVELYSVFKEEKTQDWGYEAEDTLIQIADNLKGYFNADIEVSMIHCSDFVCYMGLKGDLHSIDEELLYEEFRNSGTDYFEAWKLQANLKNAPGVYFLRFMPKP